MVRSKEPLTLEDDPLWYKEAIIYELHVRSFYDSDGDGVGDFRGLTQKLDYLQDLGITAIWLLPFYPSPLRDDGYDIADYTSIHPNYGTLRDFKTFLREAHRRGLRVITEVVLNHTSDQHPWFQRARQTKPGNPWRDFYVWSDTSEKYREARIIFKDFESSNWAWDPVAKAYYWHRFYSHQPDLNYDNPQVRRAMLKVVDFWLGMGVDGLRLDAVPYLYERDGTSCENLPETHAFLNELRRYVDQQFKNRMILAEANQWPEDAIAYFGQGDECHMAFHFPLMPRLFMAIRREDRFPIIDILQQTPSIPESCQWALFLRNHDELTLEMVTDEERDYMYRVYASDPHAQINLGIRRRLSPLLRNLRRIELMNGLLFSLPGTVIIYYGDEIGMGDNIYLGDRNGVRTPMQWNADRNAGFSQANPQQIYLPVIIDPEYHYETINVEAQQNNPSSLLWWMKRLIALRKQFKAFGRGSIELLHPENRKVLCFLRRYQDECILVVANLSRFVQGVHLNLSEFRGMVPVELFGRTKFPPLEETPYFLTLGPHSFYWFALEPQRREAPLDGAAAEPQTSVLSVAGAWKDIFDNRARATLEATLADYLKRCRWLSEKAQTLHSARIAEVIPLGRDSHAGEGCLVLVRVEYTETEPETYVLPLTFTTDREAKETASLPPQAMVARLRVRNGSEEGVLYDALWDKGFCQLLLEAIERRRHFKGIEGELVASPTKAFRSLRGPSLAPLEPAALRAAQSNTSVIYGDRLILKLFRRLEAGVNPDLEISRFLAERASFAHTPRVAGALEYRHSRDEPRTVAILHGFVPNEGDAWQYTLDALGQYFETVLTRSAKTQDGEILLPRESLVDLVEADLPPLAHETIGPYLQAAELLGRRTAELHLTLASRSDDPNFVPETFTALHQHSLYQSIRSLSARSFQLLRQHLASLPEEVQGDARKALDLEEEVSGRLRALLGRPINTMRIRCHGNYHLGEVLYTGKDFVVIDFEGEPARPLSERRIKRCPLWDVAGMLWSFHYASHAARFTEAAGGVFRAEDLSSLEPWARFWHLWVSVAFLKAYLSVAGRAPFLPQTREELRVLLTAYLLEKAIHELAYELNNRPDWVRIPLQGVLQLMETRG